MDSNEQNKHSELIEIISPRQIDNYDEIIEDLRAIIVETETTARLALIEGYHELGKQIINYGLDKPEFLSQVSKDLQKSTRTIYRILQFVRMYPDLNLLPEGKNVSWHQICNKYLIGKAGDDPTPIKFTHDDLVSFIYENSNLLADKAQITTKAIYFKITNEQMERYIESRRE